ncbi:MAG TPA: hypothetical protein VGJ90_02630 [Methylophilaceae bacterium]|jgi:hypothetical protein
MKLRHIVLVVLLITVTVIWQQKHHARHSDFMHQQAMLSSIHFSDEPQQTDTDKPSFEFKNYSVKPLANFVIRARILSATHYSLDASSTLSPIDLALGWKRMADPAIYDALNISQSGRWYHYSWREAPPIPPQEIIESSANMHMIPANESVARVLNQATSNKFIKIKGMLVEVSNNKGWFWRSSLTRKDSGGGACEVIFVEAAAIE